MATLDSKHVTWEGLEYYDSKIKNYVEQQIQESAIDIKNDVVTSSTLDTRVNELKDHIDENEAAILVLQDDDKRIDARIDVLSNNVTDNTSDLEHINSDVSLLQSAVTDNHERIDKISLDLTAKADSEHKHVLADIRDYEPVDLTNYVTTEQFQDIDKRVSKVETFFDAAQTPDDYIDTLVEIQRYIEDDAADAAQLLTDVSKLKDTVESIKVPTKISELENDSTFVTSKELQDAIDSVETPEVILDGYATEDWVNIQGFIKDIPVEYVTEDELNNKGYLTEHQSLADYAKLSDIPTDYLVSADIETKADKSELEVLATKTELEAVQTVAGSNSVKLFAIESDLVDISNELENIPTTYATKEEVAAVEAKVDAIVIPEVPTKVSELENDVGYATEINLTSLSNEGYVDETLKRCLNLIVAETPVVIRYQGYSIDFFIRSVSNGGERAEVELTAPVAAPFVAGTKDEAGRTTAISFGRWQKFVYELENKTWTFKTCRDDRTSVDLLTKTSELENDAGYITAADVPETDLSNYYNKSETENIIAEAVENIEQPTVDLDGYATEQWVKDELAKIDPSIPSEYITETELLEKGYITDTALADYAKADSIPTKTSQLTNDSNFLTEHQDISGKADKSDLDGLASTDYVDQAIARIPETDVSNLATKSELQAVEAKIPTDYLTTIPEEYVTKTELDTEGFVKSLDGYATEQFVTDAISNIKHPDPDLSNYYTKGETDSAIVEAVDGIDIPEVDLTPYATKALVTEQVATKANSVLFTADMFVTNAQGGFVNGDNLNGMSIESILIKLLGLQTTIIPDEPETIVDMIIKDKIPMYGINSAGELEKKSYDAVLELNSNNYHTNPSELSAFYEYTNEEGEKECGYQYCAVNADTPFMIALPKEITDKNITAIKKYNTLVNPNVWEEISLTLTTDIEEITKCCNEDYECDVPYVPEGYTLWACVTVDATNADYRIIIK